MAQPGPRDAPVAADRRLGDLEGVRDLDVRQATEEPHLDHARLPLGPLGELAECLIEGKQLVGSRHLTDLVVLVRHREIAAAALLGPSLLGVVDQDAPHRDRGDAEEVRPALPVDAVLLHQLEVRLVRERRGIESVTVSFATELSARDLLKLGVDVWQDDVHRTRVSGLEVGQHLGDVGSRHNKHRVAGWKSTALEVASSDLEGGRSRTVVCGGAQRETPGARPDALRRRGTTLETGIGDPPPCPMRLLALFALVLLSLPLNAQTEVPLDEALRLARTQALAVRRAGTQVQTARIALEAVEDRRLPSLNLEAGGGQRYGLSFDQTTGGLTQATVESLDLGVSASYVVFDGFERRALTNAATALLRSAELDQARAEQFTGVAVLEGYLAVAQADAAREIASENVEAQADLLSEIEVQVQYGERPQYEVSQQQERVAAAQAAVLNAERDRALSEARLVRLLGLDPADDYAFPTPAPLDAADLEAPAALVSRALEAREDLRATDAALEAAQSDARAARASRLPQVAVGAYVGTSFSSASDPGFPSQVSDNRAGALRLSVSLPIMDRGITRQRIRQAETQASALRAEQEDAQRAIALEIQELWIRFDALDAPDRDRRPAHPRRTGRPRGRAGALRRGRVDAPVRVAAPGPNGRGPDRAERSSTSRPGSCRCSSISLSGSEQRDTGLKRG